MGEDPTFDRKTITLPPDFDDEIEERREKGTNHSQYIRQAIVARWLAENDGTWVDPPSDTDIPADESTKATAPIEELS